MQNFLKSLILLFASFQTKNFYVLFLEKIAIYDKLYHCLPGRKALPN